MEQSIRIKGVCKKLVGSFKPSDWENMIRISQYLKNTQVKNVQSEKKRFLSITCRSGVLNLLADPADCSLIGNMNLHGESIEEITNLPLWRFFRFVVGLSFSSARICFYPKNNIEIEFNQGILEIKQNKPENSALDSDIDEFLKRVWINRLLEKLYEAIEDKNVILIDKLKKELSIL